ncbi:hypothetical protein BH10BDE1_BH10BDE1_01600 [soil metagenome]
MHRAIASVFSLSIVSVLLTFSNSASASTIEKVRGTQAIVVFDGGEQPSPGDKFFAMEGGKKKAVIEVVQFKNGKAKVKIAKGKAKEGMTLVAAGSKGGASASADPDAGAEGSSKGKKKMRNAGAATLYKDMTIGVVVGYAMDSQSVTPTGSTTQAMTGTGYSAKAFADIPVMGSLGLLTRVGVEQFSVTAGTFNSSIMYGAADLLLKYAFGESGFVPFAMAGLGLHFPISKTSNILQPNNISPTTVFYGGAGFNYALGGSSYFQLTGEYGMFPPSNDVSTSFISVRTGMGFRF